MVPPAFSHEDFTKGCGDVALQGEGMCQIILCDQTRVHQKPPKRQARCGRGRELRVRQFEIEVAHAPPLRDRFNSIKTIADRN